MSLKQGDIVYLKTFDSGHYCYFECFAQTTVGNSSTVRNLICAQLPDPAADASGNAQTVHMFLSLVNPNDNTFNTAPMWRIRYTRYCNDWHRTVSPLKVFNHNLEAIRRGARRVVQHQHFWIRFGRHGYRKKCFENASSWIRWLWSPLQSGTRSYKHSMLCNSVGAYRYEDCSREKHID